MTVTLPDALKLPITDLQLTYLENAEAARDLRPYSGHTVIWGSRNGLVTVPAAEADVVRYGTLTALGAVVLKAHREHPLRISSRRLGGSPIKGLGDRFGTVLRCRCHVEFKTNESRKQGGERDVMERYRTHLRTVLATMIDEEI